MQIKKNPLLEQYLRNKDKQNETKEVTVTSYGEKLTLHVCRMDFEESLRHGRLMIAGKAESSISELEKSGQRLAYMALSTIANNVVEFAEIDEETLSEAGEHDILKFIQRSLSAKAISDLHAEIITFTNDEAAKMEDEAANTAEYLGN